MNVFGMTDTDLRRAIEVALGDAIHKELTPLLAQHTRRMLTPLLAQHTRRMLVASLLGDTVTRSSYETIASAAPQMITQALHFADLIIKATP